MPYLVDIYGKPALFWRKIEEEWMRGGRDKRGGTGRKDGRGNCIQMTFTGVLVDGCPADKENGNCVTEWSEYLCLPLAFQRLPQSERVSQGLNGDLYFSNVLPEDTREDYICYARFNHTQTIQQKQPISLKVISGKSSASGLSFNGVYLCGSNY